MIARTFGAMLLSVVVFVLVSLLVGLGVLWLTGGTVRAAAIGSVAPFVGVFAVVGLALIVFSLRIRERRRNGGPNHDERKLAGPALQTVPLN